MTETKALKILGAAKKMCQNRSNFIGDLEKCNGCRNNRHDKCVLDEAIGLYESGEYDKLEGLFNGK